MSEPLLIWGAGAIGGTLGAYWAKAGEDILLVDQDADHVNACRTTGLHIHGPVADFHQVIPALTPAEVEGQFRRIILAVKAQHTAAAIAQLAPHLTSDGYVISAQNGLNELTIVEYVGEARTVGAFVNFGADFHSPGSILYGNRGAVVVGEIDGSLQPRTYELYRLLRAFEPDTILTNNIWGYLWGKLAYGAMLFATALTMESMADNFTTAERVPVFIALGREVMAVAAARHISPIGFNGFDPSAFAPKASDAQARASIAALAEFNRHTAKTHSGIWRDLAVRHRTTEVDPQLGIIDRLGTEVGVDTPLIRQLVQLIHAVEEGQRPQSAETFGVLVELVAAC